MFERRGLSLILFLGISYHPTQVAQSAGFCGAQSEVLAFSMQYIRGCGLQLVCVHSQVRLPVAVANSPQRI